MGSTQQWQLPGKVIYIMGPGRCGTTLLDVLLSNSDDITSCGELTHIFRDGFMSNQRCSCGEVARNCKVWSRLLKISGWNQANITHLSRLFALFSSHRVFPLNYLGLLGKTRCSDYAVANETLFSSIAGISKSKVIVDSSKYAGRALALTAQYPDRVFIISMTREPVGVL